MASWRQQAAQRAQVATASGSTEAAEACPQMAVQAAGWGGAARGNLDRGGCHSSVADLALARRFAGAGEVVRGIWGKTRIRLPGAVMVRGVGQVNGSGPVRKRKRI
jgi:hypothetical protein